MHQFDGLHVRMQPGILWKTETHFNDVHVESRGKEAVEGGAGWGAGEALGSTVNGHSM